jgi:VCBS repeat protein
LGKKVDGAERKGAKQMATRFLGPDFQINIDSGSGLGIEGNQTSPQITTLSDGRFAMAYLSDHGDGLNSDLDPVVAIFNADGSASPVRFDDIYNFSSLQVDPAIASAGGGGFAVVFTSSTHADETRDTDGNNITYVPVIGNGRFGDALGVGDFNRAGHANLVHPTIATLSSGRQVVAFERVFAPGIDDDIFLNVVSADGKTTEFAPDSPVIVSNGVDFEADPAVAAIGEKALVAYEFSTSSTDIVARIFDGTNDTIGNPFLIADHASSLSSPKVAALDDHRVVIIYTDFDRMFGRIYDSRDGSLSAEFAVDQPNPRDSNPAVAATADGGFFVAWHTLVGSVVDVLARRYNSDGQPMGQQFIVNPPPIITGGDLDAALAVSGANALFAWVDTQARAGDPSPNGVRGRVMSLTTQPDFNDNGVSDVLWRNDNGTLAAWDMNRNGAIGSSSELKFGGVAIRPDASWTVAGITDFSGDGRADILWRNAGGPLAIWTVNGNTITDSAAIRDSSGNMVQPTAAWSVAGVGDFNFDGKSDILWRSGGGSLALWTMDGSVIASSGPVTSAGSAVSVGASWNVAGIGDFNGDGSSDVVWRGASGELAEWQMNGSTIASSVDLTFNGAVVRPDASWSVAGVGDFNADGNSDLLWRNANGSLVEWLMDGSSILSSSAVNSGGAAVTPDASWHVVEIGDFNLDARTDILWRNDSGALAEWMMNGSNIVASTTPGSGGGAAAPDASWHTQARPTNFA